MRHGNGLMSHHCERVKLCSPDYACAASGPHERAGLPIRQITRVIPGREAKRSEPGIHLAATIVVRWIPGSMLSHRPGMTIKAKFTSPVAPNLVMLAKSRCAPPLP